MTMTMTMTMTMNTNAYPRRSWDSALRFNLELIQFMGAEVRFRAMEIPEVPGPDQILAEIEELLEKQAVREQDDRQGQVIRERIKEQITKIPDFHRVMLFTPQSHPATLQLMQSMQQIGTIGAMYFKNRFSRPRPSQLEPELRPFIDVPAHPAYPSGHATQAHLVARALATVRGNPEVGEELVRIANEVAVHREYAGVHYASDSEAGRVLAYQLFRLAEDTMEETFLNAAREWR